METENQMNTAQAAQTGVTTVDAAPQMPQDESAEFEELIRGKYKKAYDARVQDTVTRRLKGAKQQQEKYESLVRTLAERCGVDAADLEGIEAALAAQEDSAAQRSEGALRLCEAWQAQEKNLKTLYPAFDMGQALENEQFRCLLRSGIDVQTAYEVLHKDELLPAAMAYAARAAQGRIAKRMAAMGSRPAENAMGSAAAAVVRRDVSNLSKSDIDAVARRVARGERVSFG